jgi:hypothetical protein
VGSYKERDQPRRRVFPPFLCRLLYYLYILSSQLLIGWSLALHVQIDGQNGLMMTGQEAPCFLYDPSPDVTCL